MGPVWSPPDVHTEQRGTEKRKGSTRVLTQAAALSVRLLSAPQETVIRIRAAGIMENLKLLQNNTKQNRKSPDL